VTRQAHCSLKRRIVFDIDIPRAVSVNKATKKSDERDNKVE
jgi:hypothetical protein